MTDFPKIIDYLRARLNERSTWADLVAAAAAAAVLPGPWAVVGFLLGVVKALVADGPLTKAKD